MTTCLENKYEFSSVLNSVAANGYETSKDMVHQLTEWYLEQGKFTSVSPSPCACLVTSRAGLRSTSNTIKMTCSNWKL